MSQLVQLLVSLFRSLRLWVFVHAWETGLRVRRGSSLTELSPGIHLCVPVLDRVYTQNSSLRTSNVSLQTLTTRDGRPVVVASTITWRITDISRLYCCPNGCRPLGWQAVQDEATAQARDFYDHVRQSKPELVTESARRLIVDRTSRRDPADLPTSWKQADGTEISISSMGDRHLLNSYRMMQRNGFVEVETLRVYLYGPEPTAEMAYDAYRQEQQEVFERRPHLLMDGLRREINRRGLKLE